MHCRCTPAPPLSAFVHCFWYWEGAPQPHARERLMPNGEAALIFNLRDDEMRLYDADDLDRYTSCGFAGLTGPRTGCFAIDTASEDRVIGIEFLPGGTFPFFREPAGEIANQSTPLECLWGRVAGEIREQLLAAPSVDAMFDLLKRALLQRMVRPLELHPAVDFARAHLCRAPQIATVPVLSSASGSASGGSSSFSRPDRSFAQGILPCAPLPARARKCASQGQGGLGAGGSGWRLLRPGPLHPRFPGFCGDDAGGVSGAGDGASEPRADGVGSSLRSTKRGRIRPRLGIIFTNRSDFGVGARIQSFRFSRGFSSLSESFMAILV